MVEFRPVKKGSSGTDVAILQAMLRMLQYVGKDGKPITVDGNCGDNTVFAINKFQETQRAYGVECGSKGANDGVFGTDCWKRLMGV